MTIPESSPVRKRLAPRSGKAAKKLRFPPYAKRIYDMRRRGRVPESGQIAIAVADWKLINPKRSDAVVLPPGESPAKFDWRFVANLPVLLIVGERHFEIANELAQLVIRAGCRGCAALIQLQDGSVAWHVYASHGGPANANS
jgi:hypothetical protein